MTESDEERAEESGPAEQLAVPSSYKVRGAMAASGGAGVYGYNTASAGTSHGVLGRSNSGGTDAAGVRGKLTANSGQNYGVYGTTGSSTTDAAGVRGDATGGSGTVHGVYGTTSSTNGYGVYSNDDAKVVGNLDVTGDAAATNVNASSDVTAGGNLYGNGILDVVGYQNVGQVGSTAWFGGSPITVANNTLTQVPYDQVQHDDRNEFDAGSHLHRCQTPGQYHVTASVQWGVEAFSSFSDTFSLYIHVNGTVRAQLLGLRGRSGSISKTLRELTEDDEIAVFVEQSSGSGATLEPVQEGTFMTVDKIG